MKIVFAKTTAVVGQALVRNGSHWPADDPLVLANPSLFTEDPRYGLSYSVEPPLVAQVIEPRVKRKYVRRVAV